MGKPLPVISGLREFMSPGADRMKQRSFLSFFYFRRVFFRIFSYWIRLNYFKKQKDFKKKTTGLWVEDFNPGKHSIVLKTAKNADISEFILYYAGECTGFTVETSADGKNWKKHPIATVQKATVNEVKYLSVPCAGTWKEFKISFNVPAGKRFLP